MMAVREEQILAALYKLEPVRWWEVLDFIDFLQHRPLPADSQTTVADGNMLTASALASSDLVGLWADRTDIGDSVTFARQLRQQAQTRTEN